MTIIKNQLILAAETAAMDIETTAAECGIAYSAAQSFYGVSVEALIGCGEWTKDLADPRDVEAVRFFDCDGVRGEACRTVDEVEAEKANWVCTLETSQHCEE